MDLTVSPEVEANNNDPKLTDSESTSLNSATETNPKSNPYLTRRDGAYAKLFADVVEKSFSFEAQHKNQQMEPGDITPLIHVQEHMAECRVAVSGPTQVLRQAIERQKSKLDQMKQLFYLGRMYADRRAAHIQTLERLIDSYTKALDAVNTLDGWFLPSRRKFEQGIEFIPMNLHIQQITAWTDTREPERHEMYTSGAISAQNLGFKDGGGLGHMRVKLCQQIEHRCSTIPLDPSPTAAYWAKSLLISEQLQRVAYIKAQLMKATTTDASQVKIFPEIVNQLWDVFAQMRTFADSLSLLDEMKTLAEAFEAYRKQRHDEQELNMDEYEVVENGDSRTEQRTGIPREECTPKSPTLNVEFELENLDTQYSELEAHMACITTKSENLKQFSGDTDLSDDVRAWALDFRRAAFIVLASLERLGRSLTDAWNFRYLVALGSGALLELYYRYEHREDALISQALTMVSTGIAKKLWFPAPPANMSGKQLRNSISVDGTQDAGHDPLDNDPLSSSAGFRPAYKEYYASIISLLPYWERLGIVVVLNSYLSCYRDEKSMLDDAWDAVRILRERASVRFVRSFSVGSCMPMLEGGHPPSELRISVPVPAELWEYLPASLQGGCPVSLQVFLFSEGINDEQSLATTIGDVSMEYAINDESFACLRHFSEQLVEFLETDPSRDDPIANSVQLWRQMISELGQEVGKRLPKNVAVLHFASRICRLLSGVHTIFCKSGKDRTSMAATLEEAFILQERFGLPDAALQPVLDDLRSKGTRLDNVRKNALLEYYAFAGLRLKFLPELYRPPRGFYKAGQT